jgi:hypothetical protein
MTPEQEEALRQLNVAQKTYEEGLYAYLRIECPTLEKAKSWIRNWAKKQGQKNPTVPGVTEPYIESMVKLFPKTQRQEFIMYSVAKMAVMLSCAVEKRGAPNEDMTRADTIHGWNLYHTAVDEPEPGI